MLKMNNKILKKVKRNKSKNHCKKHNYYQKINLTAVIKLLKLLFNNKKRKLKLLKKTCKIKIMNKKRKALKIQILSATIKIA